MVDFIKVTNTGVPKDAFLNNPYLQFTHRIDIKTGEIINCRRIAQYHGMSFIIATNGVTGIEGSLHKYYNEGLHNHNDFTLANLQSVIEDLKRKFGIDPTIATLNNVEFGVNLEVPFNPDEFIERLVTHGYNQFNNEKKKDMNYSQVMYSQYLIKIYNKGLQYSLDKNLLRFEVKIVRMEKIANFGINTLVDLTVPEKIKSVMSVLLKVFDEIIIWDDSIDRSTLKETDKVLLHDGYNPKFWHDHHKKTKSNASKKFRQYQELVRKYGNKDFHSIGQLICDKWDFLSSGKEHLIRDITEFQEHPISESIRDITAQPVRSKKTDVRDITALRTINGMESNQPVSLTSNTKNTRSYNLSIGKDLVSLEQKERVCLVTGLNISMQKVTSRFLSVKGIKYHYEHEPEIFRLLQERLTNTWATVTLDKQVLEIAHSIRNTYHSKRIHTQKAIKRLCLTPSLFNNYDLVSDQKKNIANS